MECSAVVPCLRRGVHVDALFVVCVCLRPWFSWVGGFVCTTSPYLSHLRYKSLMHGGGAKRRSYQHSHLACYTRSTACLSAAR